ncbi:FtsL-like putative cell division protein [Penaeicola halotolerans]|uniref:FtsL-like putative cell division protein n=1 Tax=Penaeicola halotolerans TaxID=2793196 RepID=UPI001CF92663|nr:FtsL-like putative cell division protein [Penaeicola halotolerans]
MASNTPKAPKIKQPQSRGKSIFSLIESKLKMEGLFGQGVPVKLVPPFLFAALLVLIYIWSNHQADKTVRNIERLQQEVEDLRADVTTLEAEYMYSSKQSEVSKKVRNLGIVENDEPPFKILVED